MWPAAGLKITVKQIQCILNTNIFYSEILSLIADEIAHYGPFKYATRIRIHYQTHTCENVRRELKGQDSNSDLLKTD
jgi:hypothetical protein